MRKPLSDVRRERNREANKRILAAVLTGFSSQEIRGFIATRQAAIVELERDLAEAQEDLQTCFDVLDDAHALPIADCYEVPESHAAHSWSGRIKSWCPGLPT